MDYHQLYQQSNVGLAKIKNPLLRWAKHETELAHVSFLIHQVFGIVGSQIKIKWIFNIASVITIFDGLGLNWEIGLNDFDYQELAFWCSFWY
jgi:hypothetical protein